MMIPWLFVTRQEDATKQMVSWIIIESKVIEYHLLQMIIFKRSESSSSSGWFGMRHKQSSWVRQRCAKEESEALFAWGSILLIFKEGQREESPHHDLRAPFPIDLSNYMLCLWMCSKMIIFIFTSSPRRHGVGCLPACLPRLLISLSSSWFMPELLLLLLMMLTSFCNKRFTWIVNMNK